MSNSSSVPADPAAPDAGSLDQAGTVPRPVDTIPLFTTHHGAYQPITQDGIKKGLYANVQVVAVDGVPALSSAGEGAVSPPGEQGTLNGTGAGPSPAASHMMQVDTGSWVTVMSQALVKQADPAFSTAGYPKGHVEYSSNKGHIEEGVWVDLTLGFPDAQTSDGKPVTSTVRVLVTTDDKPHYMLGVGFNDGFAINAKGIDAPTPADNAILNVDGMKSGAMAHSYVIDGTGLHLGAAVGDAAQGWAVQQLRPETAAKPGVPADWYDPEVTLTNGATTAPHARMLVDTGIQHMINEFVGGAPAPATDGGDRVSIALAGQGGTTATYAFDADQHGSGSDAPSGIVEAKPHTPGVDFVNTGLPILRRFDYGYDADRGVVGLRDTQAEPGRGAGEADHAALLRAGASPLATVGGAVAGGRGTAASPTPDTLVGAGTDPHHGASADAQVIAQAMGTGGPAANLAAGHTAWARPATPDLVAPGHH